VITIPIFRDTSFLPNAVEILEANTRAVTDEFRIVIAEDGSNSSDIVNKLTSKFGNITYFQHDKRLGRGRALREAWDRVSGDVYAYVDADMASDLDRYDAFRKLIGLSGHDYDLVTGSRYLPESVTERPLIRWFASVTYNWLVRTIFGTGVHDHQCGFKSFSRRLVETLSKDAKSDSWFWDTEVIVIAKKRGYRIIEIPVLWTEKKGKRTPLKRLAKDIWLHGSGFVSLFWRVYVRKELESSKT
jgi:glycosyltransferase involved in cell wall biosynthesis